MKTLPKNFCIKSNQEHELWREFIQRLNEKGANYDGLSISSYYGIEDGKVYCRNKPFSELITLEDWYKAVNAKSDFPEPVFVTKSGIEIYDEEEVLVWDSNELYARKALLIAKTEKEYITLNNSGFNISWENAKPILKGIEVTMEEIAKWKGVDVKQIKIK